MSGTTLGLFPHPPACFSHWLYCRFCHLSVCLQIILTSSLSLGLNKQTLPKHLGQSLHASAPLKPHSHSHCSSSCLHHAPKVCNSQMSTLHRITSLSNVFPCSSRAHKHVMALCCILKEVGKPSCCNQGHAQCSSRWMLPRLYPFSMETCTETCMMLPKYTHPSSLIKYCLLQEAFSVSPQ